MKHEITIENVMSFLKKNEIKNDRCGNMIAVNRDSMCNSKFSGNGLPEETTYPNVLKAINDQFPCYRFYWFSKNDEVLFLDALIP